MKREVTEGSEAVLPQDKNRAFRADDAGALVRVAAIRKGNEERKSAWVLAAEEAMGEATSFNFDSPYKHVFLLAMAKTGNISHACRAAKLSRAVHYLWMKQDEEYTHAFALAKEIHRDAIQAESYRRAVEGIERPVYQAGALVGTELVYSDKLLEVMLRGSDPDTYQRKQIEVSGTVDHHHSGEVAYQVQAWHLDLTGAELLGAMRKQMQDNKLGIVSRPPETVLLPAQTQAQAQGQTQDKEREGV